MFRWFRFLFFVISARRRLRSHVALTAKIKFPDFVSLGEKCFIRPGCFIDAPGPGKVILGNEINMNRNVYLGAFGNSITIGDRTQLNRGASIDGRGPVELGCDVLVGPGAQIIAYQHRFADKRVPINRQGFAAETITVEDDVWIGANATILAGVRIGRGSVVGAGAVVTKSCPPYSILGGVPARIIGQRGGAASGMTDQ